MVKFSRPKDECVLNLIFEIMVKMLQARRLFDTAASGTPQEMLSLIKEKHVNAKMRDNRGRTILHTAVQYRKTPIVTCLLNSVFEEDPSPVDDELDTPLHCAVRRRDYISIDDLVAKGADVNSENRYHETPITLASSSARITQKLRIARLKLIKGKSFGIQSTPGGSRPNSPAPTKHVKEAIKNFQITVTEVYNLTDQRYTVPPSPPTVPLPDSFPSTPEPSSPPPSPPSLPSPFGRRRRTRPASDHEYAPDHDHHWRLSLSVAESIYGSQNIEDMIKPLRPKEVSHTDPLCTWFHIPQNNITWVEDLFAKLGYFGTLFAGRGHTSDVPQGRAITPHVAHPPMLDDTNRAVLAILVPYVSYDVNEHQRQMNDFINTFTLEKDNDQLSIRSRNSTSVQSEPANVSSDSGKRDPDSDADFEDESTGIYDTDSDDKALIQAYLHDPPALHVRRTLDQFYYHMLSSTDNRDEDQVVSRYVNPRKQQQTPPHNVLMVDQLWIWRFTDTRGDKHVEYVISSFPDRAGVDIDPTAYDDNLRRTVLEPRDGRRPINGPNDLVFRILGACANVFDRCQDVKLLQFLQIFENSIGKVSDKESLLFKRFQNRSKKLHRLREGFRGYDAKRKVLLNLLLDIRKETELLVEIKDILDEINIILSVLDTQNKLLQDTKFDEYKERGHPDGLSHFDDTRRIVVMNIIDFMRMKDQAREVQASLNTLMDLKQKAANAWEAKAAREGAEATAKQGLIMVVFTAVTIIFLPLSFMTSFFALDVSSFPQDPVTGQANWPLGRICAYIFGISAALIAPLLLLAANVEWLSQLIKHWRKVSLPTFILHCLRLLHKIGIDLLRIVIKVLFKVVKEHRDKYARVQYEEEEPYSMDEKDVSDSNSDTEITSLGPDLEDSDFQWLKTVEMRWASDSDSESKDDSMDTQSIDSDSDDNSDMFETRKGKRLTQPFRRWRRRLPTWPEEDSVSEVTEV